MAQEENSDLGGTFSTLNINAMEFVPSFSFRPRSAATPSEDVDNTLAAATEETLPSLSAAASSVDDNSTVLATNHHTTSSSSTPTTPPDQTLSVPEIIPSSNEATTAENNTENRANAINPAEENHTGLQNDHTYATITTTAVPSEILADGTPENAG